MDRIHPVARWCLLVPASIAGAIILPFLFGLFTPHYIAEGLIFQCVQSIITAVGFVGIAAYVAPHSRNVVGWIFAGLFSLFSAGVIGMILMAPYRISMPPTRAIILYVAGIGGAIYAGLHSKDLSDKSA